MSGVSCISFPVGLGLRLGYGCGLGRLANSGCLDRHGLPVRVFGGASLAFLGERGLLVRCSVILFLQDVLVREQDCIFVLSLLALSSLLTRRPL